MVIKHRLSAYLDGKRYTLWTFIKYFERSKDPAHCRRLKAQMRAALKQMQREGEAIRCKSIKGGESWRRSDPNVLPF